MLIDIKVSTGRPARSIVLHMVRDDSMPSFAAIAEYWCDRPLPGSERIALEDLGEPQCFACGSCRLEQVHSPKAQRDIWKGLQRAHAVARSLGGSNAVENLALLCESCHEESPDTADAAIFWKWIANHPENGSMAYLVQAVFGMNDFNDLRAAAADYSGPWANYYRGLCALTDDDLTALESLAAEDPDHSVMLLRLREAGRRLGGVTRHWSIGLASGTVSALLREVVRYEREEHEKD